MKLQLVIVVTSIIAASSTSDDAASTMRMKAFERVRGKPTGQDPGLWLHQVGGEICL